MAGGMVVMSQGSIQLEMRLEWSNSCKDSLVLILLFESNNTRRERRSYSPDLQWTTVDSLMEVLPAPWVAEGECGQELVEHLVAGQVGIPWET